jgi:O-antigen/teichoic acid export membrane protein
LCRTALSQWPGRALYVGNQPNIGMIPNLNQCIARASGRYLLFLHDDDYLLPGGTGAILSGIRSANHSDAALLFGVQVVDGNGDQRRHQSFRREQDLAPADAVIRLLSDPSFVRVPGIVVQRRVFEWVGTFDETVGNPIDFDQWLRIFSRFGVRCLPATISAYSVHEAAETTHTFTAETVRTNLKIFDRAAALGVLPERLVRECEADWFCQFFLAGVSRRLAVGDRQGAAEIMRLFRMPEIQALGFSSIWLALCLTMGRLVPMPARMSRPIARWMQYHGYWSTRLQRIARLRGTGDRTIRIRETSSVTTRKGFYTPGGLNGDLRAAPLAHNARVLPVGAAADASERSAIADTHEFALLGLGDWFGKGIWAIGDRALFSLSNFGINIVLARLLSPHDYGAFTLTYAIFLLLGAGHTALLTDPMLVFGAGTYKERFSGYIDVLLQAHWAFSAAAGVLLLLAALGIMFTGQSVLATSIVVLAFASPLILLQWLLRLACYVRLEPHRAAYAGASYMTFVLLGIYGLEHVGWLSPTTSIGLMGIASLGSVVGIMRSFRRQRPPVREPHLFHEVVADHWSYSRWIVGSNALAWIPQSSFYLLLPAWGGLGASAALKALMNLIMPLLHIYWALAGVVVPTLVRARERAAFGQIVRLILSLWLSGALLYWILLGTFNRPLVDWFYNGRYSEHAGLLWIIGILPILYGGELLFNSVLRSRERPDQIFWASVVSTVVVLTVGVALIVTWGLRGAAIGLLFSPIVNLAAMTWQYRKPSLTYGVPVTVLSGGQEHEGPLNRA